MSDITVVTSYFDIGRGEWPKVVRGREMPFYAHRNEDTYLNYFSRLATLKNDMVIYTEEKSKDKIYSIRQQQAPDAKTEVVVLDFQQAIAGVRPVVDTVINRPEYIDLVNNPHFPEYWNADYVLVNYMKSTFVNHAIEKGLVNTDLAAWIDFGYVREEKTLTPGIHWKHSFNPTKMHYFNLKPLQPKRPMFDIIKTGDVYIMGCHIVGGKEAWKKQKKLSEINFDTLIRCGLMDDDQTILLMNYLLNPNIHQLHYINENDDGWFVIFNKFNNGE